MKSSFLPLLPWARRFPTLNEIIAENNFHALDQSQVWKNTWWTTLRRFIRSTWSNKPLSSRYSLLPCWLHHCYLCFFAVFCFICMENFWFGAEWARIRIINWPVWQSALFLFVFSMSRDSAFPWCLGRTPVAIKDLTRKKGQSIFEEKGTHPKPQKRNRNPKPNRGRPRSR